MSERQIQPRTIQQQVQRQAERNRAAVQRGLQHARHEQQREMLMLGRKLPDSSARPIQSKAL